ncbi:MAG: hypothetical protein QOF62_151 [Pyrinomonadaceae bacterium]|jgi:anti-sigma regulatory factor (Ser/Thr protein kinase)|nr:hypothetical protein [Pyrinomonadaceae bacterium]
MMDRRLIRDRLESFGNVSEVYEVTTFTGHRNGKTVTIRILDQGPDCPNPSERFACEVIQDDGKEAGGNNARTIDEAIGIVHWENLD